MQLPLQPPPSAIPPTSESNSTTEAQAPLSFVHFTNLANFPHLRQRRSSPVPEWLTRSFYKDITAAYQVLTQRRVDAYTNTRNFAGKIWMTPVDELSSGCLCGDPARPVAHTWWTCPSTIVDRVVADDPEIMACDHEDDDAEHAFCFSPQQATHDMLCFLLHSPLERYDNSDREQDGDSIRLWDWMTAYQYNDPDQRGRGNGLVDWHARVLRGVMEAMGREDWPPRERYGGWVNGERLFWLYGFQGAALREIMDELLPEMERNAAIRLAELAQTTQI